MCTIGEQARTCLHTRARRWTLRDLQPMKPDQNPRIDRESMQGWNLELAYRWERWSCCDRCCAVETDVIESAQKARYENW